MASYKLIYFNACGRGEIIRWLFELAGQKYEDVRLTEEEWQKLKPSAPFRQIPMFEAEGKTLCQTNAIAKYVALKFGLAGKTDIEKAEVDEVIECTMEIINPLYYIEDQVAKEKRNDLMDEFRAGNLRKYLTYLQEMLVKNNNGEGFFVGNSPTLADIMICHVFFWLGYCKIIEVTEEYPKLKAFNQRFESLPAIADWIKRRPVTPF